MVEFFLYFFQSVCSTTHHFLIVTCDSVFAMHHEWLQALHQFSLLRWTQLFYSASKPFLQYLNGILGFSHGSVKNVMSQTKNTLCKQRNYNFSDMETKVQRGLFNYKIHSESYSYASQKSYISPPHHFPVSIRLFPRSSTIPKWPIKNQNYEQRNQKTITKGCIG